MAKEEFKLCGPGDRWELWIAHYTEELKSSNAGLFVEAETKKEAVKNLKALIKIIQEKGVEFD